jgi:hypothetical protein
VADASRHKAGIKTQDPAGQTCSTPSRVKVTVPSRT